MSSEQLAVSSEQLVAHGGKDVRYQTIRLQTAIGFCSQARDSC